MALAARRDLRPCHLNLDLADVAAGIWAVRERAIRRQDAAPQRAMQTRVPVTPAVAARCTQGAAPFAERSSDAQQGRSVCSVRELAPREQRVFLRLPELAASRQLVL